MKTFQSKISNDDQSTSLTMAFRNAQSAIGPSQEKLVLASWNMPWHSKANKMSSNWVPGIGSTVDGSEILQNLWNLYKTPW